jgi:hypothetical protein
METASSNAVGIEEGFASTSVSVCSMASHLSENGNREFWLLDPDGYTVVLTSPLG